jgi:hypothetical protein
MDGTKVNHKQDDFTIGEEYVLNLADAPVLMDGDVNDTEDILVNQSL